MRLWIFILSAVLLTGFPASCSAASVGVSGNLEVGPTYNSGSQDTIVESHLGIKLELNQDEKQSGVVLLQYKAKTPESLGDWEDGYNTLTVNQAYLDITLSPESILRAGRQKIAWGSGLAWNPTNYFGADKNRADMTNEFPGVDAVDFETVFGQSSLTVVVKQDGSLTDWGEGVKYVTRLGRGDLAFSAFRQGSANGFGFDWATSLGDYTIYTELASKAGTGRFYVTDSGGELLWVARPAGKRFINGVIGINRTFPDNVMVQLEYYFNEAGWDAGEADHYARYLDDPAHHAEVGDLMKEKGDLFGDLRKKYLYFLIRKAEIADDWTMACRVMWNIDDGGLMITPMAEYRLGQSSQATFMINLFTGGKTTEFGGVLTGTQYTAKVSLSF